MLDKIKAMFQGRNLAVEKSLLEEKARLGSQFEDFVREFYPLFDEHVFKVFERDIYNTWVKLPPDNKEAIRNAQSMQLVIEKLRARITQIIGDGQFAQHQLNNSTPDDWGE